MLRSLLDRTFAVSTLFFILCPFSVAQVAIASSDSPQLRIESLVISGTQSIGTAELAEITNAIAGSKFDDDNEDLQEVILAQFQDRGYFTAVIQKLEVKVLSPLRNQPASKLRSPKGRSAASPSSSSPKITPSAPTHSAPSSP
jgi:hypothetical protein